MDKVTLFHFETSDIKVTIEAYFRNDWLMVEGYDIGKRVEEIWGDSDYEYSLGVNPGELKKLYPLFGICYGDKDGLLTAIAEQYNTNSCYSQFMDLLTQNGIKAETFSWM